MIHFFKTKLQPDKKNNYYLTFFSIFFSIFFLIVKCSYNFYILNLKLNLDILDLQNQVEVLTNKLTISNENIIKLSSENQEYKEKIKELSTFFKFPLRSMSWVDLLKISGVLTLSLGLCFYGGFSFFHASNLTHFNEILTQLNNLNQINLNTPDIVLNNLVDLDKFKSLCDTINRIYKVENINKDILIDTLQIIKLLNSKLKILRDNQITEDLLKNEEYQKFFTS
jgi:hypothetical protein